MNCKKCGTEIEKEWKYCPSCSKRTGISKFVILIIAIVAICVVGMIISYINANKPIDEKYLKKALNKKYNENFEEITFIKSIENQDYSLSCDGSDCGTIKGEGAKEYYTVYSSENDIDFCAFYDTSDFTKTVEDTYEKFLSRREVLLNIYKEVMKSFEDDIDNVYWKDSLLEKKEIKSVNQLKKELSRIDDGKVVEYAKRLKSLSDYMFFEINEDGETFIKENYEELKKLNDEIVSLGSKYNIEITIQFNKERIEFDGMNGKIYVYADAKTSKGTEIEKFIEE